MIIAEFDNMFAKFSEQQLVKDILDGLQGDDYKGLFTIETTSSPDAKGSKNKELEPDEIWDKIKERMKQKAEKENEKAKGCQKCCFKAK